MLGSGLGFKQSLHALLSAFAISGLILGSVAPVTFFLAVNVPEADSAQAAMTHSSYLLIHVLLIAVAGLAGVVRLRSLLEAYTSSAAIARSTLGAWIAGNALLDGDRVRFPDAVSERARRHLELLAALVARGERGVMVLAVNRPEGSRFAPAGTVDPAYAETLARVCAAGVEALAVRIAHTADGMVAAEGLAVDLTG